MHVPNELKVSKELRSWVEKFLLEEFFTFVFCFMCIFLQHKIYHCLHSLNEDAPV